MEKGMAEDRARPGAPVMAATTVDPVTTPPADAMPEHRSATDDAVDEMRKAVEQPRPPADAIPEHRSADETVGQFRRALEGAVLPDGDAATEPEHDARPAGSGTLPQDVPTAPGLSSRPSGSSLPPADASPEDRAAARERALDERVRSEERRGRGKQAWEAPDSALPPRDPASGADGDLPPPSERALQEEEQRRRDGGIDEVIT